MVGTAAIAASMVAASGGAYLVLSKMYGWWPFAPAKVETIMVVTTIPPSDVGIGEEFTFAGYLEDVEGTRLEGKTVDLCSDGSVIDTITTDSSGVWSFAVTPTATLAIYAKFPGDEQYKGC